MQLPSMRATRRFVGGLLFYSFFVAIALAPLPLVIDYKMFRNKYFFPRFEETTCALTGKGAGRTCVVQSGPCAGTHVPAALAERAATVRGSSCAVRVDASGVPPSDGCGGDAVEVLSGNVSLGRFCGNATLPDVAAGGDGFTLAARWEGSVAKYEFDVRFACDGTALPPRADGCATYTDGTDTYAWCWEEEIGTCPALDVVVLLDGSGSMGDTFGAAIDELKAWVRRVPLSGAGAGGIAAGTRVAFVQYGSEWEAVLAPRGAGRAGGRLSGSAAELEADLEWHRGNYRKGASYVAPGLRQAAAMFSEEDGRKRSVYIVGDGRHAHAKDDLGLSAAVGALRDQGAEVFGIVVDADMGDREALTEMSPLLSPPHEAHFISVPVDEMASWGPLAGICPSHTRWGGYDTTSSGGGRQEFLGAHAAGCPGGGRREATVEVGCCDARAKPAGATPDAEGRWFMLDAMPGDCDLHFWGCESCAPLATPAPTTRTPPTVIPPTVIPPTVIPPTHIPTTGAPTTGRPSTGVPNTALPSTGVPTTGRPTTGTPNTAQPSTGVRRVAVAQEAVEPLPSAWLTLRQHGGRAVEAVRGTVKNGWEEAPGLGPDREAAVVYVDPSAGCEHTWAVPLRERGDVPWTACACVMYLLFCATLTISAALKAEIVGARARWLWGFIILLFGVGMLVFVAVPLHAVSQENRATKALHARPRETCTVLFGRAHKFECSYLDVSSDSCGVVRMALCGDVPHPSPGARVPCYVSEDCRRADGLYAYDDGDVLIYLGLLCAVVALLMLCCPWCLMVVPCDADAPDGGCEAEAEAALLGEGPFETSDADGGGVAAAALLHASETPALRRWRVRAVARVTSWAWEVGHLALVVVPGGAAVCPAAIDGCSGAVDGCAAGNVLSASERGHWAARPDAEGALWIVLKVPADAAPVALRLWQPARNYATTVTVEREGPCGTWGEVASVHVGPGQQDVALVTTMCAGGPAHLPHRPAGSVHAVVDLAGGRGGYRPPQPGQAPHKKNPLARYL